MALAVAGHFDMVRRFGTRRSWVRCDEATSFDLFLELIARSVGVEETSNDRLRDTISYLERDQLPRLILLDNFETPMDIEGRASDVEDVLCTLAGVAHLTILLTMRGTLPARDRMTWTKLVLPTLEPLSADAARQMYIEIDSDAEGDKDLDALLSALGHVPLAVKLMANVGSFGEAPSTLLKRWNTSGLDMLDGGDDRRLSVNKSITISIQSRYIAQHPESLKLLSVLAFIPSGATSELIECLSSAIPNISAARYALLRTSLIYGKEALRVLSPIRIYMNRNYPIAPELLQQVRQFFYDFLAQHPVTEDATRKANLEAISKEEVNIEGILTHALQGWSAGDPLASLEAAHLYMEYECTNAPRMTVALVAIGVARRAENRPLLAKTLHLMGKLYTDRREFEQASPTLNDARVEFQLAGDKSGAAYCELDIGHMEYIQAKYDEGRAALRQARKEFLELGDLYGAARCLRDLADIDRLQSKHDEAREAFREAQQEFQTLGHPCDAAWCIKGLGNNERFQGNFDSARQAYIEARKVFQQLGEPSGAAQCQLGLGDVDFLEGKYDEAKTGLREALAEFERLQDPACANHCLQILGDIDRAVAEGPKT